MNKEPFDIQMPDWEWVKKKVERCKKWGHCRCQSKTRPCCGCGQFAKDQHDK